MMIPGQKVQCGVYVCGEYRPTYTGVVTQVYSGYCDVDIMSLHGGAPWIVKQPNSHLREVEG